MEKTRLKILKVEFIKTKSNTVRARADVHFDCFTLKGFKIIRDEESQKDYVTPPSYQVGEFWRPLFKTDNKEDWQEIQRRILNEFNHFEMEQAANEVYEKKET